MNSDDKKEAPRVYANNVELTATALDLSIEFGFQVGDDPPEPLFKVVMAWEEGAILKGFLEETLSSYEEIAGSIRRVHEIQPQPSERGG